MRFWKDCQTWSAAFPAAFREFAAYEAEALTIWTFQHSLVPGLLQTEGYARAVLERHPNVTGEQVSERVAARLSRQSVLEGPTRRCCGCYSTKTRCAARSAA